MNKEETIKDIQDIINANCWTISEHFAKNVATALYNAGYCKTFSSDFASDTQKAYKEGYDKGIKETKAKIEILKIQNKNLEIAFDRLEARSELFESNMKSVLEIEKKNAVKEFAERVKAKAFDKDMFNDWAGATYVVLVRDIDELLKEFTE